MYTPNFTMVKAYKPSFDFGIQSVAEISDDDAPKWLNLKAYQIVFRCGCIGDFHTTFAIDRGEAFMFGSDARCAFREHVRLTHNGMLIAHLLADMFHTDSIASV